MLALSIFALAFAWAPLVGFVAPIGVLAGVPMARRLAHWYAAYFPYGFPNYSTLNGARALAIVALCLTVAVHIVYVLWQIWLNTK